jgi:beta-xylosidase
MLQDIIDVTGLQTDIKLKEAHVLNIQASISHRKRYISYNPTYIASLNKLTRNKWAVMTLLAHEVGHHLNGHTIRKGGSTPELELEADEFAGFILQKLGATLQESQNVMHYISIAKESRTHPGKNARLKAIEKGWNKAAASEHINATARR